MNRRLLAPLSAATLLLLLLSQGCDLSRVLKTEPSTQTTTLTFTPTTLPDAEVGHFYRTYIKVSGMETPFGSLGVSKGLPDGLFYGVAQGDDIAIEVSGTPTRPGDYEFVFKVTCLGTNRSGQEGSEKFHLRVK